MREERAKRKEEKRLADIEASRLYSERMTLEYMKKLQKEEEEEKRGPLTIHNIPDVESEKSLQLKRKNEKE